MECTLGYRIVGGWAGGRGWNNRNIVLINTMVNIVGILNSAFIFLLTTMLY